MECRFAFDGPSNPSQSLRSRGTDRTGEHYTTESFDWDDLRSAESAAALSVPSSTLEVRKRWRAVSWCLLRRERVPIRSHVLVRQVVIRAGAGICTSGKGRTSVRPMAELSARPT